MAAITATIDNDAQIADGVNIGDFCVIQGQALIESRFDVAWASHPDGATWTVYRARTGNWIVIESALKNGQPAFQAGVSTSDSDDGFENTPSGAIAQYLDFMCFDGEKQGSSQLTPTEIETVTELGETFTELRRRQPHPDQIALEI